MSGSAYRNSVAASPSACEAYEDERMHSCMHTHRPRRQGGPYAARGALCNVGAGELGGRRWRASAWHRHRGDPRGAHALPRRSSMGVLKGRHALPCAVRNGRRRRPLRFQGRLRRRAARRHRRRLASATGQQRAAVRGGGWYVQRSVPGLRCRGARLAPLRHLEALARAAQERSDARCQGCCLRDDHVLARQRRCDHGAAPHTPICIIRCAGAHMHHTASAGAQALGVCSQPCARPWPVQVLRPPPEPRRAAQQVHRAARAVC
jgi:hypothetical protein